uniref:Uncharacterized protein n=1 Tax=Anguilla anguilla TaxID=7936 RepID=A0A0E9XI04_ANGAN
MMYWVNSLVPCPPPYRFLPGETQSSSHVTEIGAVKTGGPPTVPKIPQQYYCLSQELSPTDLYTFTRRT